MESSLRAQPPLALALALCSCAAPASPTAPPPAPAAPSAAPALPSPAPTPPAFPFEEVSVAELTRRMSAGELTARALTQAYLDRIAAIDRAGPRLNSVIEINPRALDEAAALDAERRAGRVRGPLHGVPVLIKDNIDATPMVNSAGSLALADHRPPDDAFLVRRLREGGAVILGKTNLSEWANIRSSSSTSGWSARGGQTRNPYALDRNPCGSSAGTGAAIAASLAAAGVGTETNGSIICPSAVSGLVGIKPTVGLVSRDGIIPISHTQDTAGPMARTVADAAALLDAMAGVDPADAATVAAQAKMRTDHAASLDAGALKGARVGVLRKHLGRNPDVDAIVERAIATMKAAGAEVLDVDIPTAGQWDDDELKVLLYELKAGLNAYLSTSRAPVKTLAEVIRFNKDNAATEMPWFGQDLFEKAEALGPLTDREYVAAVARTKRLAGPEGIDAALDAHKLDALLAPATGPAWTTDIVNGDHFSFAGWDAAAVAGYPSVTVPAGDVHGLPVGVVLMGRAFAERRLIGLAYAFEQRSKARRAPAFRETIGAALSPE